MEPSNVPSLVNGTGVFFDLAELIARTRKGHTEKCQVERELNAQVEQLLDTGISIDHFDSHESLLKYPFFSAIIRKVATRHGIMAVRTYTPRKFDYTRWLRPKRILVSLYLAYQKNIWRRKGFKVTDKYDSLIRFGLDRAEVTEIIRDIFQDRSWRTLELAVHPGYCNGDTTPLGDYVKEREVELEALLSDDVSQIVSRSGAELVSFGDIYR